MRSLRSIHKSLVIFIFGIMGASAIISFVKLKALYSWNIINELRQVPLLLPIIGFIIALILATIAMIPFTKYFLKPIYQLIDTTKEVGKGNFDIVLPEIKISPTKPQEIKELNENFNRMVRELSSIEMMKKDFINNFSHEFKSPISSIIGFAKELQREDISKEEKDLYTSIILHESERLSELSANILLLSKLENQTIVTNQTNFYLDEQIRETILMMQNQWESKNLQFSLDLENILYYGNAELLHQVWINLINNAIKFSNENGEIQVRLYRELNSIKIKVRDHGIGIEEEALAHVFEKFYQGDSSHSTMGNGLGLSLVKKIIDLCKGSIVIKSKVNEGTIVSITLPIMENNN